MGGWRGKRSRIFSQLWDLPKTPAGAEAEGREEKNSRWSDSTSDSVHSLNHFICKGDHRGKGWGAGGKGGMCINLTEQCREKEGGMLGMFPGPSIHIFHQCPKLPRTWGPGEGRVGLDS